MLVCVPDCSWGAKSGARLCVCQIGGGWKDLVASSASIWKKAAVSPAPADEGEALCTTAEHRRARYTRPHLSCRLMASGAPAVTCGQNANCWKNRMCYLEGGNVRAESPEQLAPKRHQSRKDSSYCYCRAFICQYRQTASTCRRSRKEGFCLFSRQEWLWHNRAPSTSGITELHPVLAQ